MKKIIVRILKKETHDDNSLTTVKALRKITITEHLKNEVRTDQDNVDSKSKLKEIFNGILQKLEDKGKIIMNKQDSTIMWHSKKSIGNNDELSNTKNKRLEEKVDSSDINSVTEYGCKPLKKRRKNEIINDHTNGVEVSNVVESVSNPPPVSEYPPIVIEEGTNTILLFYAYCTPQMTASQQDNAISHCYKMLSENNISGRLRVGREVSYLSYSISYLNVRYISNRESVFIR